MPAWVSSCRPSVWLQLRSSDPPSLQRAACFDQHYEIQQSNNTTMQPIGRVLQFAWFVLPGVLRVSAGLAACSRLNCLAIVNLVCVSEA